MKEIYISFVLITIFICSMIIGYICHNFSNKEKFNFLINFHFEMKSQSNKLTLIFRITLAFFCGICSIDSLVLFFISSNYLIEKILSLTLIFNSFLLVSLFINDMKSYKPHLVNSILFMIFNVISYALLGYFTFRSNFVFYPLWFGIVCFVIAVILLFIALLPRLKNWYVLKKDEEGNLSRGKIFPLAFIEWINILFYVLLFVLAIVNYIIFTL